LSRTVFSANWSTLRDAADVWFRQRWLEQYSRTGMTMCVSALSQA